jgi:hypothetical protein
MSQESSLIKKIKTLIEERRSLIVTNKKHMRDNLKEYKKNLELDRKLKAECRTLQESIYGIMRGLAHPDKKYNKEKSSKNIAINRNNDIVNSDEE